MLFAVNFRKFTMQYATTQDHFIVWNRWEKEKKSKTLKKIHVHDGNVSNIHTKHSFGIITKRLYFYVTNPWIKRSTLNCLKGIIYS